MKSYNLKHCKLQKTIGESTLTTSSWIPEKFASIGKTVKLKNSDNTWSDGWIATLASSASKSSDEVNLISKQLKNHRKVSDI